MQKHFKFFLLTGWKTGGQKSQDIVSLIKGKNIYKNSENTKLNNTELAESDSQSS